MIRKANIRLLTTYITKNYKSSNIEVEIYEAEDGIESIYTIYVLSSIGISIDAIITDESMKYMRGSESLSIISNYVNNNIFNKMKMFICSAYSREDLNIKEIENLTDYIIKPMTINKVENIVNSIKK